MYYEIQYILENVFDAERQEKAEPLMERRRNPQGEKDFDEKRTE